MTRNLVILGSTGSIGTQALEVCDNLNINVVGLSAANSIDLLERQTRKYKPLIVSVMDHDKGKELKIRLKDTNTKVVWGIEGMVELVTTQEADTVLTSVVGIAGLIPTMKAIEAGKNIALANKETLVTAGKLVMEAARKIMLIYCLSIVSTWLFFNAYGQRAEDVEVNIDSIGWTFRGYTKRTT